MKTTFLVLVLLCACVASRGQSRFALGINIDNANAFVNIVNHTARYSRAVGYDSDGWPTSNFDLVLLDGRPVAEWSNVIDDPEQYRIDYSGRYQCSFVGQATVRASGTSVSIEGAVYDSVANTTQFALVVGAANSANHGMVFLSFTATRRSPSSAINSGITRLVVNRPGYPLSNTQTFTNEYLRLCQAADFSCYRYYNVQNIWDGEPTYPTKTRWTQRKTPSDAAQVSLSETSGKRDGWCWEYIIELANILKKDVWLNIHMSCDSTYVTSLATLLKRDLPQGVTIYVESSNEVWSPTQLTHGPYNAAEAALRGITFDDNHAHRTVELSRWFGSVFGADAINNRIRVIMAGQLGYHGRTDNHLRYIQRVFGAPKNFVYATSAALYFGSTRSADTDPTAINDGMISDINSQISNSQTGTYRPVHITKADQWQLLGGCTSYEGGPGVPEGGNSTNLANKILANRTRQMGDVVKHNYLQGWRDIGGGLALYFALASGYNRYGCWGITDDPNNPDRNFKMQAIRDMIGPATSVEATPSAQHLLQITYNPSTQSATASLPLADLSGLRVEVVSLVGQQIEHTSSVVSGSLVHIDLSHAPLGLYVVRVGTLSNHLLVWR